MSVQESKREIAVQSVMQRHPVTIRETETVQDAVEKMTEYHIAALPVVDDGGYLQGLVTISDLLRLVQDAERTLDSDLAIYDEGLIVADMIRQCIGTDHVAEVMTGIPITISQGESLKQAARMMIAHQVHHILVVGTDRKLLGLLSSTDYVRLAADSV